jgi:hypothetical protein
LMLEAESAATVPGTRLLSANSVPRTIGQARSLRVSPGTTRHRTTQLVRSGSGRPF